jgi:hypothetical protein
MAATSAVQTGIDGELYRNTASWATPTWVAIGLVKNLNYSRKWNRADASARQTKAILQAKTQIGITGSMDVRADPADVGYAALYDAAQLDSASAPDLLVLDGPITQEGARGFRAHLNLDDGQDQNIDGVIYTKFDFDPAWNIGGYPAKAVVTAPSTVTFTQY